MDENAVARALSRVEWVARVVVLGETASTNDDALRLAAEGAPHGTVVVAERQTAGRGRLGRAWLGAPGDALTVSWVVRPSMPVEAWSMIPLAAGIAAVEAVRETAGVDAVLKWPNDVLVGDRKLGGILVEARPPDAAVVGLGVNVAGEPPVAGATSIEAEGSVADRVGLLAEVLARFGRVVDDPEAVRARYRAVCATLGRRVRVDRSDGSAVTGIARDVDERGALVVEHDGALVHVSAGDVVHLRNAV